MRPRGGVRLSPKRNPTPKRGKTLGVGTCAGAWFYSTSAVCAPTNLQQGMDGYTPRSDCIWKISTHSQEIARVIALVSDRAADRAVECSALIRSGDLHYRRVNRSVWKPSLSPSNWSHSPAKSRSSRSPRRRERLTGYIPN